MRPIKLIMSAFGPYADRTELPMERLGEDRKSTRLNSSH